MVKRVKKYNNCITTKDHITKFEHQYGIIGKYFNDTIHMFNTVITVRQLINEGFLAYRMCFLFSLLYPDTSIVDVRDTLQKAFIPFANLDDHAIYSISHDIVNFSADERELIILMLVNIRHKLFQVKSRTEYAKITQQYIYDSNIYINLCHPHMKRWIDKEMIDDTIYTCVKRIESDKIIAHNKKGGKVYFTEEYTLIYK